MTEAGSNSQHLEQDEQEQAGRHAGLSARVVHEIIRDEGEEEIERETGQLIWSGLAAGLSMGFSFLVQALIRSELPAEPWAHLIDAAGYTVGFVIVVLGRQQLFTESTLTAVLPVLTRRDLATASKTLRLWAWVLGANLVGTWLFAAMLHFGKPFAAEVGPALSSLAEHSVSGAFGTTLLEGILAGWLIALMVWLIPSARSASILVIVLITYVVALAQLSHIIAGSAEAAYAVLSGSADLWAYAWRFFVPTLIGNTVGGVIFVALLNHAPVSTDLHGNRGEEPSPNPR